MADLLAAFRKGTECLQCSCGILSAGRRHVVLDKRAARLWFTDRDGSARGPYRGAAGPRWRGEPTRRGVTGVEGPADPESNRAQRRPGFRLVYHGEGLHRGWRPGRRHRPLRGLRRDLEWHELAPPGHAYSCGGQLHPARQRVVLGGQRLHRGRLLCPQGRQRHTPRRAMERQPLEDPGHSPPGGGYLRSAPQRVVLVGECLHRRGKLRPPRPQRHTVCRDLERRPLEDLARARPRRRQQRRPDRDFVPPGERVHCCRCLYQ